MNTQEPSPSSPFNAPGSQPPPLRGGSSIPDRADLVFAPLESPATLFSVLENLLKHPGRILHECANGNLKVCWLLVIGAVICLGVFGALLGTFSGGDQYWASPLKFTGGALTALLICLPSLYIFSALSGADVRFSKVAALLLAFITLTALLLLLGFAPVAWIFSQSTNSEVFMGLLTLAFWLIGLMFGVRLLFAAAHHMGAQSRTYLSIWVSVFLVVSLQMSTSLRPLIGAADTFLPRQKMFFLEHWVKELSAGVEVEQR